MKIVLNGCYGGFSLSAKAVKALGLGSAYNDIARDDEKLIELIESGFPVNGRCAQLEIVEIPNETTDWEIDEYDGLESITYVVNGKLYHA